MPRPFGSKARNSGKMPRRPAQCPSPFRNRLPTYEKLCRKKRTPEGVPLKNVFIQTYMPIRSPRHLVVHALANREAACSRYSRIQLQSQRPHIDERETRLALNSCRFLHPIFEEGSSADGSSAITITQKGDNSRQYSMLYLDSSGGGGHE